MPYTFLHGQRATASFTRVSTGLLASVSRVSPSFPFAGSFAGSCHPVFHNLLMPKHRSWSQLSDSVFLDRVNSAKIPLFYGHVKHFSRTPPNPSSTPNLLAISLAIGRR